MLAGMLHTGVSHISFVVYFVAASCAFYSVFFFHNSDMCTIVYLPGTDIIDTQNYLFKKKKNA